MPFVGRVGFVAVYVLAFTLGDHRVGAAPLAVLIKSMLNLRGYSFGTLAVETALDGNTFVTTTNYRCHD